MQSHFKNPIQVVEDGLSIKEERTKADFQVLSTSPSLSDFGVAETKFKSCDRAHEIVVKQTKLKEDPPVKRSGRHAKKKLQRQDRKMHGKGITNTIGEYDFLFELRQQDACEDLDFVSHINSFCPKTNGQPSDTLGGTPTENQTAAIVHHWEVSVKFLLYVGPWEAFGLSTPDYAWWSMKNPKHLKSSSGDAENFDNPRIRGGGHSLWKEEEFLGCFLGPHAGETLSDRKDRMKKQLFLSSNPSAASVLFKLFGNQRLVSSASELMRLSSNFQKTESNRCKKFRNLDEAQVEEKIGGGCGQNKVLKVLPRALLKGYLFYEYPLWHFLSKCCRSSGPKEFREHETLGSQCQEKVEEAPTNAACPLVSSRNSFACLSVQDINAKKACLNSEQWIGWWVHMHEFSRIATLPAHQRSLWYIVPKHEWLSPVVIIACEDGCEALLTLENFLSMSEKVAREAMEKNLPRKRRFMVAEVCWKPETVLENMDASRNFDATTLGHWAEVSRGFVVEDTWPDSKSYAPHGFVASWSPHLENLNA